MSKEPSIAIIIPYYKIDFFEECLASVANQTDKRFTLYIGNDASPNDPKSLVDKYFPAGNYHYFHYEENVGGKNLTQQWQRILDNVKEDWFQILGDDDIIEPNFIKAFYNTLPIVDQKGINVIKTAQYWINDQGTQTTPLTSLETFFPSKKGFIQKLQGRLLSSLSEHIFRKSAYLKYNFVQIPLAWGTDDLAVLEFSEYKDLYFLNTTFVKVRVSDKSITGTSNEIGILDKKFYALEEMYEYILFKNLEKFNKEEVRLIVKEYLHLCWKNKKVPSLNLYKIYFSKGDYGNLLKVPTKLSTLKKNASS